MRILRLKFWFWTYVLVLALPFLSTKFVVRFYFYVILEFYIFGIFKSKLTRKIIQPLQRCKAFARKFAANVLVGVAQFYFDVILEFYLESSSLNRRAKSFSRCKM